MRRTGCLLLLALLSALAYGQSANPTNPVAVILVDPSTGNTYNSGGSPVSTSFYPIANFTSPISVTLIDPSTGNPYKSTGAPTCTLGQLVYYATSGATFSCLTLGTNLTLSGSTLNASSTAATAFSALTGSTNTTAAMLVGAGASLGYTSTGTVSANELLNVAVPSLVNGDCLGVTSSAWAMVNCGGGSTTFQVNGTGLDSSSTVNFENSAATDGLTLTFANPSAGIVQLGFTGTLSNSGLANSAITVNTETCTLGLTCTIPFDINSSALTSQAGLNFITSTTNSVGLIVTPSNPATNETKFEITGSSYTGNAATATNLASYPTLCSGSQFSQGLSSGSNNCSTPSGSGITLQTNGTNNTSQTALNIENGQGVQCSNPSSGNVQCETTQPERTVTGTTDTISCTTDSGSVILYNSSSAVAVSVPQATGSCAAGFAFTVENAGSANPTLTPTTSTIQGLSALVIPTNQGCSLWSDGTNYQVASCTALSSLVDALSSGTSITPNCAYGANTVTITGNATINAPTGCTPHTGQKLFLDIQSASSYTYTASSYITGSTTGSWPASSTGSSKDDHFELIYDGYLGSPGWTLAAYNLGL